MKGSRVKVEMRERSEGDKKEIYEEKEIDEEKIGLNKVY